MQHDDQGDSRRARGERTLNQIHPGAGEGVVSALRAISPDFADILVDFPFGDVYSRPGLDLRSRQIATIAALAVLGTADRQIRWHIRGGLNVGLTRAEILEVIVQMSVYGGFPSALNALAAMKETFDDIDAEAAEAARQDDA